MKNTEELLIEILSKLAKIDSELGCIPEIQTVRNFADAFRRYDEQERNNDRQGDPLLGPRNARAE